MNEEIKKLAQEMYYVLNRLRKLRDDPDNKIHKKRIRQAINCFEAGCMYMIGSMFPTDYDPRRVFMKDKE